MTNEEQNYADAGMIIRRPVSEVFNAIVDPEVTTKFWFTKSTGKLEAGKTVTWTWEMYGASADVKVETIEADKRIIMFWGNAGSETKVEWNFRALDTDNTYLHVKDSGFTGTTAEILAKVRDSTGGYTTVIDGLKAWLELGIQLNLVGDKFPAGK
ncbi:MAG: polyketide cyclase [Chitinophagaceae bacterium]|nr:MAG: polyketide cyclase [Chitinophagaceae bacterium]